LANKSAGAGAATSIVRPVVTATGTGAVVVPVVRPPVATATGAGAGATCVPVRGVVPVRLFERVLMIDEVLVRAMVEWFESKGVGDIPVEYRQQSKRWIQ